MDIKGLTDKEVKESRAKFGSNEIPDSEPTTFFGRNLRKHFKIR